MQGSQTSNGAILLLGIVKSILHSRGISPQNETQDNTSIRCLICLTSTSLSVNICAKIDPTETLRQAQGKRVDETPLESPEIPLKPLVLDRDTQP